MCATVARRYMDEDGQAEQLKDRLLSGSGEDARDTLVLEGGHQQIGAFCITLPKFRSRLIQLSLPCAAASSSAE